MERVGIIDYLTAPELFIAAILIRIQYFAGNRLTNLIDDNHLNLTFKYQ
jgi:hypothetical protein